MPTLTDKNIVLPSNNHCVLDANTFYSYFTKVCCFHHEMEGIYTRYYVNPELGDGYMDQIRFENGLEFCITSLQLKHSAC